MTTDYPWQQIISTFAHKIGLRVSFARRRWKNEFLPGIVVWRGGLSADPNRILDYGDIFHDMGHLAILPSDFRKLARGNVDASICQDVDWFFKTCHDPDHPTIRALIQAGENEAMAWSYAAQIECGLPPKTRFIIHDSRNDKRRYATDEEVDQELWALSRGQHFGVHGLAAAGMTNIREFPKMIRWVQP